MFKNDPKKNTKKLFEAIASNKLSKAKKLIKKDINWKKENGQKEPPLFDVIERQRTDFIELFLEKNAPEIINAKNSNGKTPLTYAIQHNLSSDIINLLIKKGAKFEIHNAQDGETPLMYAARYNRIDTLKLLIEKNARIDTQDIEEETALFKAIKNDSIEATKLLLDAGANIHIKSKRGNTPLSLGINSSIFDIKAIFKELEKTSNLQSEAKAREEAQRSKNKTQTPLQEAWVLMGEETIACVTTNFTLERKLTDVFNFRTGQNITLAENLKTKVEIMSVPIPLTTLPENTISRAFEELEKLGGSTENKPFNVKAKQNGFKL